MDAIVRTKAALNHEEPDTVPVMCVNEGYHLVYQILGKRPVPLAKLVDNPLAAGVVEKLSSVINRLRVLERVVTLFMFDRTEAAVKTNCDAAWVMYAPIWDLKDSHEAVDIYGRLYSVVEDGYGNLDTPMYKEGLIKTPADWEAWPRERLQAYTYRMYRSFKKLQERFGDRIYIFGSFLFGLNENAWQIMGFRDFVLTLKRDMGFIKRIIKYYEDFWCSAVQAMADAGLPGVIYTDDVAYRSGPMLSPETMRELYADSWCRIVESAHSRGMKIVFHTDGDIVSLLDLFIECGFDGVHALEPTAGVDIGKVKDKYGDRLCLLGNIDITRILVDASRDEVFAEVRERIRAAAPGGGYILAPTNSHKDMTMRNYRWMVEAAREYGVYPIG